MQPPPPPFSARLHLALGLVALVSGTISLLLLRRHRPFNTNNNSSSSPLLLPHTLFTFTLTLLCYVTGARAPPQFRRVINPIISGGLLALLILYLHGLASGLTLQGELALYLTGRSPLGFLDGGAYRWVGGGGDILYYCLEPSVLALGICELNGWTDMCWIWACRNKSKSGLSAISHTPTNTSPLPPTAAYENFRCLRENTATVLGTLAFAFLLSLLTSAALARALVLPQPLGGATLARNITAPLAAMIARMLGTDVAVTLLGVFGSSLYGVLVAEPRLRWYGMHKDFVVKGLAVGVSCHGLGTASLVNEPEAMAFSAVDFILCGIMTVLLFTIPPVREFFAFFA